MVDVMVDREHRSGSVIDRESECQTRGWAPGPESPIDYAGSALPRVSSPNGNNSSPMTNASEVSATGVPIV